MDILFADEVVSIALGNGVLRLTHEGVLCFDPAAVRQAEHAHRGEGLVAGVIKVVINVVVALLHQYVAADIQHGQHSGMAAEVDTR